MAVTSQWFEPRHQWPVGGDGGFGLGLGLAAAPGAAVRVADLAVAPAAFVPADGRGFGLGTVSCDKSKPEVGRVSAGAIPENETGAESLLDVILDFACFGLNIIQQLRLP